MQKHHVGKLHNLHKHNTNRTHKNASCSGGAEKTVDQNRGIHCNKQQSLNQQGSRHYTYILNTQLYNLVPLQVNGLELLINLTHTLHIYITTLEKFSP